MTHALAPAEVTAQIPAMPPTDDQLPVAEPPPGPADRPHPARVVAGLLAGQLSGLVAAGAGELVQLVATVTDDTVVVVDMTRLSVTGPEASARIRLTLTRVAMSPPSAEPGDQADGQRGEVPAT